MKLKKDLWKYLIELIVGDLEYPIYQAIIRDTERRIEQAKKMVIEFEDPLLRLALIKSITRLEDQLEILRPAARKMRYRKLRNLWNRFITF